MYRDLKGSCPTPTIATFLISTFLSLSERCQDGWAKVNGIQHLALGYSELAVGYGVRDVHAPAGHSGEGISLTGDNHPRVFMGPVLKSHSSIRYRDVKRPPFSLQH